MSLLFIFIWLVGAFFLMLRRIRFEQVARADAPLTQSRVEAFERAYQYRLAYIASWIVPIGVHLISFGRALVVPEDTSLAIVYGGGVAISVLFPLLQVPRALGDRRQWKDAAGRLQGGSEAE